MPVKPNQMIPEQRTDKRLKTFTEVSLGFSKRQALEEAGRCLQCQDALCRKGCPLGVDIPRFIQAIRDSNLSQAALSVRSHNHLAAVCGRICSADCEKKCILTEKQSPIAIRALERFASDQSAYFSKKKIELKKNKKVAVVGSGPAGLTAAGELVSRGFSVTLFESLHLSGGSLRYMIPEFRLPKKVLNNEIDFIRSFGVDILLNCFIGQTLTLEDLFKQGFNAVCLAVGLAASETQGILGEDLGRVIYAEEFLMRVNLFNAHLFPKNATSPAIGKKIIIIGNDVAAVDSARVAVRLGLTVTLVFSQSREELNVDAHIKRQMTEEGVRWEDLAKPLEILSDAESRVRGLRCQRMDFADPNSSGKWKLIPVKGSEFEIEADTIIISGRRKPNNFLNRFYPDLALNKDGTFSVNKNTFVSSRKGIFVCGEAVSGASPVVEAMAMGKRVALEIEKYLKELSS